MIRPPLASGRLRQLDADTLTYTLKTPWADGTTHLVLSPLALIEKLTALVPPPRLNLIRYQGVLPPTPLTAPQAMRASERNRLPGCIGGEPQG